MSQITGLIDGSNVNHDYQLTALANSLINTGVISGLLVSTNSVALGEAFIPCTRTNGQIILVHYQNTAAVTIDTTGTKKVWIGVDQSVIDNGSSNALDGTGIATIRTGASYPAGNFIPLASIASGVITDARVSVTGKPILQSGFPINKAVYIEPSTGNQVLKDTSVGGSLADTDLVIGRTSAGNENRVPFSAIKNQLGTAGKYIQTYLMGEAISAGDPTAVCVKTPFTRTNILPYCQSNTSDPDFIFSGPEYNSSYSACAVTLGTANGWYPSSGSGTFAMVIDFGNVRRIITGITTQAATSILPAGWTLKGSNDNVSYTTLLTSAVNVLTTQATQTFANTNFYRYYKFEATFSGANGLKLLNFDESFTTPGSVPTVYKASALDYLSANIAGFVTGAKSIGDSVDLNISEGTPIGGFSAITKGATYFLSNTPGVLSTTPGNVISPVGLAKSTSILLVLQNPGFPSKNTLFATGAFAQPGTGNGRPTGFVSAPRFFHGGIMQYYFAATTSNVAGTGVAKLQYSDDGINNWKDIITHAGDGFITSGPVYLPRGYFRVSLAITTYTTTYNVTITD